MTVKELAAKVEALEAEVAYLRGALAEKSQPIVIHPGTTTPYPYRTPYVHPYIVTYGVTGRADQSTLRNRLRSAS